MPTLHFHQDLQEPDPLVFCPFSWLSVHCNGERVLENRAGILMMPILEIFRNAILTKEKHTCGMQLALPGFVSTRILQKIENHGRRADYPQEWCFYGKQAFVALGHEPQQFSPSGIGKQRRGEVERAFGLPSAAVNAWKVALGHALTNPATKRGASNLPVD